jgi:hypothetical protein
MVRYTGAFAAIWDGTGFIRACSMARVLTSYQAIRGASFLAAMTFAAEIWHVRRFDAPPPLMAPGAVAANQTAPQ